MRKNLTKIAMSCILILSIIGCAGGVPTKSKSTFYETSANEVCTYKILGEIDGDTIKYEHYDKVCTEYGSNVVKIMGENMAKKEK